MYISIDLPSFFEYIFHTSIGVSLFSLFVLYIYLSIITYIGNGIYYIGYSLIYAARYVD